MANCRPAGLSDEDSDSDDNYGYFDKLNRNQTYSRYLENTRQKTETKLQDAIINGDLEGAAQVIRDDLGDDVNSKLESGWTPLAHACFHAQENIVQFLLDKGADPNVHADSVTPIMMACSNSGVNEAAVLNIVSSLIEKDCILNFGDKYGMTPLMRAVVSGRSSVVEFIVNKNVNIEMRDRQGWTAVFWAIHHNQPQCLDILLSKGARLNIVDSSNRTPEQIAYSHDHVEIHDILQKYVQTSNDDEELQEGGDSKRQQDNLNRITHWHDYYPGLRDENKPKYVNEIAHLLYGMNCDRLTKNFQDSSTDLRTFLLLEDEDMMKLGIEMPFARHRLKQGLRNFHTRSWKVNAVAGLQTLRADPYSIVQSLNILGTHLQQLYILESTLTYVLRDYSRIQNQIKFEPPDSPPIERLHDTAKKMIGNINNIRREISVMKKVHIKISQDSLQPADLIVEKSTKEVFIGFLTKLLVIAPLSVFVCYRANAFMRNV